MHDLRRRRFGKHALSEVTDADIIPRGVQASAIGDWQIHERVVRESTEARDLLATAGISTTINNLMEETQVPMQLQTQLLDDPATWRIDSRRARTRDTPATQEWPAGQHCAGIDRMQNSEAGVNREWAVNQSEWSL